MDSRKMNGHDMSSHSHYSIVDMKDKIQVM